MSAGKELRVAESTPLRAAPVSNVLRWLPLVAYVVLALVVDSAGFRAIILYQGAGFGPSPVIFIYFGVLLGQIYFAILLGGLWTRSWVFGFILGCLLASFGVTIFVLQLTWQVHISVQQTELFWGPAFVPLGIVASALPLCVLRFWRGWHLTSGTAVVESQAGSVSDLFLVSAVVASALFLARMPQIVFGIHSLNFWPPVLISFSLLSASVLFFLVPLVWISFGPKSIRKRLLWQLLFCIVLFGSLQALLTLTYFQAGQGWDRETAIVTAMVTIAALVSLIPGIWALWLSGVRLVTNRALSSIPQPSAPADARAGQTPVWRVWNRRLALGFIGISLIAAGYMGWLQSARADIDRRADQLNQTLSAQGGFIRNYGHQVVDVELGEDATDESLAQVSQFADLQQVSLKGSQITDRAFEELAKFPSLQLLDLSRTQITSAAVPKILNLNKLRGIKLANTNLAAQDVQQILTDKKIDLLDLSDLPWPQADLKRTLAQFRGSLALRNYQLSDDELLEVVPLDQWGSVMHSSFQHSDESVYVNIDLDLRGNQLTGKCFQNFSGAIRDLRLDGNPLTDRDFGLVARKLTVQNLHLSDTKLTNAILKDIAIRTGYPEFNGLFLGDGEITEDGLHVLASANIFNLQLRSKQFTGACFERWHPSLTTLDLGGSGLTDRSLKFLRSLPRILVLSIANTSVTDAGLPHLVWLRQNAYLSLLDVSDTKITAEGLCKVRLSGLGFLLVAANQFSDEELAQIRTALPGTKVEVTHGSFQSSWRIYLPNY